MPFVCFPLGPLQTNSYLVHQTDQAIAIDVGGDPKPMLDYLKAKDLTLKAICITHLHFDHIYGVAELAAETKATVYCPTADQVIANTEAAQGGIWGFPLVQPFQSDPMPIGQATLGDLHCTVLETPGHTPGGVSLFFPALNAVFVGDALFYRSIGRTDFPGGDHDTLLRSIREQLFTLPPETEVLSGHGPTTTIQDEMKSNPYVGEFAF